MEARRAAGTAGVEQSQAVFGAGTRNYLGSVGVEHVTQGIAGNQCAHGDATHGNGRGAHAALHGPLHAKNLADHGAGASAYIALGRIIARCGGTGGIAGGGVGADAHVAHQQVKQHGGGHDGQAAYRHVKAHAAFLQPAHGAGGGLQPPGAAASQHDGVHLFNQIARVEQVGLARARCCAAHIDTAHGAFARHDHGATGGAARVGEVAHLDAGHAGDAASVAGGKACVHGR